MENPLLLEKGLVFELDSETGLKNLSVFNKLKKELEKIGKGERPQSQWFNKRKNEIIQLADKGYKIEKIIKSPSDIRILINLWTTNNIFFSNYPVNKKTLKIIKSIKKNLSPSLLYGLIRIFFNKYDEIYHLKHLCIFLQDQLEAIGNKRQLVGEIAIFHQYRKIIFYSSPDICADFARKNFSTPTNAVSELCIPKTQTCKFLESFLSYLYIDPISQLYLGENSHLFQEIVQENVKITLFKDSLNIGQAVVIALMEKVEKENSRMPENWMRVILNIMGDPRIPDANGKYKKWWLPLNSKYERLMRKWLAQIDLIVFLEALEEVGRRTKNNKIHRMFPARKAFLEAIYKTDKVNDTRLFLGSEASKYINEKYDEKELPLFSKLKNRNKSVIYLNINGIHFIEGTHNFSVRVFDFLPQTNQIQDMDKKSFTLQNLSTELDNAYKYEFSKNPPCIISHDIHNAWQGKLTEALSSFGIDLGIIY